MLLRQLNIAPRAALGFALIAVLVALLGYLPGANVEHPRQ
jgi:hypothetical protein